MKGEFSNDKVNTKNKNITDAFEGLLIPVKCAECENRDSVSNNRVNN